MNATAAVRQMQRSDRHHQRLQSSEHSLFDSLSSNSGGGKCMQTLPSSSGLSASQQVEYSRMLRIAQRVMNGEFLLAADPSTPPISLKPTSQMKTRGDVSPSELSPGILDLHSFDTELLSDIQSSGLHEGSAQFGYTRGRGFDDSDPSYSGNNQMGKASFMPENDLSKSFAADMEKPASVAKIK